MKFFQKLKSNHSGFTMVELLVAVLVLGIVSGAVSLSLGLTPATQAKEITLSIYSIMTRTKTATLARSGDVYMKIYLNASEQVVLEFYEDDIQKEKEVFSSKGSVKVHYFFENDNTSDVKTIGSGPSDALYIGFDRRTNGFLTLKTVAQKDDDLLTSVSAGYADEYVKKIVIDATSVVYNIDLGPVTGTYYKDIS